MQLQQAKERIEGLKIQVLAVTFEREDLARLYVEETELVWPMLVDNDRELYAEYGMERGGWWTVFGMHSWAHYIKLLLRGRKLRRPTNDVRQLGGDVLIDPEGIVRFHFVSRSPIDRPSVDELLETVAGG